MSEIVGAVADWAITIVTSLGYPGIFLLILLEAFIPLIPGELLLPLAGVLVSRGQLEFPLVLLAATAGSLLSALALYGIGATVGESRLTALWARLPLLRFVNLERSTGWFRQHGAAAVLLGRVVPSLRTTISLPAGVARLPLGAFVLCSAIGCSIWNGLLITLGVVLGEQWETISHITNLAGLAALAIVAVLAGAVGWRARRRALAHR